MQILIVLTAVNRQDLVGRKTAALLVLKYQQ